MSQYDAATASTRKVLQPRTPGVDLDPSIPRHWLGGDALATHLANAVILLTPQGELFFVRSVHHHLARLDDPGLRALVRGFFLQEAQHRKEHERAIRLLEGQGYDVRTFLRLYERVAYGVIEPLTPHALRLSTTAALEHFTAVLGRSALGTDLLDGAHPAMRALLRWHAAEELEHRAVAFDVLGAVAPGYATRMAGLAMAAVGLGAFWLLATALLLRQEEGLRPAVLLRSLRARLGAPGVIWRGIRDYARPGFHPAQRRDLDRLADELLATLGRA